jgi:hypothetical protein
MTTKGKSWKWTDEQKAAATGPRPASKGNQNGVKHGLSRTPEYNSWKKMMYRCNNPENKDYADYGGRGIQVCERWHNVVDFYADMGQMPELEGSPRMSIERVDVNGNYQPENCIWLPNSMQPKNRRPWKHTKDGIRRISESRKKSAQRE